MKNFLIIFCTSLLLSQGTVFGILPPLHEGIRELTAILKDPQLGQLLHSGEVIINITKTEKGYAIVTNQHELFVNVVYKHNGKIGPQSFALRFDSPIPIEK